MKFRHNWSYSIGQWEYELYSIRDDDIDPEELDDLMDSKSREHSWSDKYRGMDYFVETKPPLEWLEKERKKLQNRVNYYQTALMHYQIMVENYAGTTDKPDTQEVGD